MGSFSDLDKKIDEGKERARDAKGDFDQWREENL